MKQLYKLVVAALTVLLIPSCADDPDLEAGIHNALKPSVKTGEISKTTANSVTISGEVLQENGAPVLESGFCWGKESKFSFSEKNKKAVSKRKAKFDATIEGLDNDEQYYIRAYAINVVDTAYGDILSFTTKDGLGFVKTLLPSNVRSTTAQCGGVITNTGEAAVEEKGVYLMSNMEPSPSDSLILIKMEADSFYCTITNLKPETQYYFRAYARNKYGEFNGAKVESFTTTDGLPIFDDSKFKQMEIDYNAATFSMAVVESGDSPISTCGFCYGTKPSPTIENADTMIVGYGVGEYVGKLDKLEQHTEYYVRAYATNENGTRYSEGDGIKTILKNELPTVSTGEVTSIINGSVKVSGNVLSEGATEVVESGICWSTKPNPTIKDNKGKLALGKGKGEFSGIIERLKGMTKYYVRAYATNSNGTVYGEDVSFTTPAIFTAQQQFKGGFRLPGSFAYCTINDQVACLIGGDKGSAYTDEFWGFIRGEWRSFWPMPEKLAGLTCFSNDFGLWAFGGVNASNTLNSNFYFYSSYENKWKIITDDVDRPKGMFRPMTCTAGDNVYLIAGRRDTLMNEVFAFNLDTKKWSAKRKLPEKQFAGVSVVINDRVYAGLGVKNLSDITPSFTKQLWSNDLNLSKEWTSETVFPGTGLLAGVAYGKYIYGVDTEGFVWSYDTENKTWDKRSQLSENNRLVHCMFVLNDEIYIGLGNDSDSLLKYDPSWDN